MDVLLEGASGGRSGVLMVRGEAGIGKTALLEFVSQRTSGFGIVRAVGVESERELAFAALHQLCAPLVDRLDRLPGPQRDALATTFGLIDGAVPDRLFVGLAMLGLLSEAAKERPLLCIVDDAQWLDQASAQALAFVARRLSAEPIAMIFGARKPGGELAGLPELAVKGLAEADARELLRSVVSGRLDGLVADQIIGETRGNPLALLEFPRGLSAWRLAGGFGLPGALSLEGRIEQRFLARLHSLPKDTQRLVLLAAADPVGDPALLWRAASLSGSETTGSTLEPAVRAGLLDVTARVRFRHPLARSTVYRAASAKERREVHRALAEATDASVDADRRAWHLAEATPAPDERVAAELERAAGRAQARGGLAAAAAFLERASRLTLDKSRCAERALAAAQSKFRAGAIADASALLTTAEAGADDDRDRAVARRLRAQVAFASERSANASRHLLDAARALEPLDSGLARDTYLEALSASLYGAGLAGKAGVVAVSEAARQSRRAPGPPRAPDLLLQGSATLFTDGYGAGAPLVKEALNAFRRESSLTAEEAAWQGLAAQIASYTWDDEAWMLLSGRELERAREAGALTALVAIIPIRTIILAISGELVEATALIDEMRALSDTTGIEAPAYAALRVAALRGREAELSKLVKTTVSEAAARGEGLALDVAESTSAVLHNGLGRFDAALSSLRKSLEHPHEVRSTRALPELIEAAQRAGQPALARRALARLAETTRASGTDWALGMEARSRALLSDGDVAEVLYREAIERLDRTHVRVEVARAHLLYGEWLRRRRRRVDAREQLRTAREMFAAMGAEAFAGRAEREILATGERARRRSVETRERLTAQEAQVAHLARDGLSNTEIGARLFISQHTVAYHLRKVFTKLGISSRNQLARVLPPEVSAALPPQPPRRPPQRAAFDALEPV